MLIIKAKGGLGNRLLSAASAIAYAEATNRVWQLDWRDGLYDRVGENAVEHLFDVDEQDGLLRAQTSLNISPLLWTDKLDWPVRRMISEYFPNDHSNPLVYRKLSAALEREALNDTAEVVWSYTSKYGRIKKFLSKEQKELGRETVLAETLKKHLRPKAFILSSVNVLLEGAPENTLGVHIRFTDLKVPIKKVISNVKEQIKKFKYHAIFLATDSAEAEELFRKEFTNVITQSKRLSTDNRQLHNVDDYNGKLSDASAALIDMLALSKCRGLVYCSRSTFSECSRLYGSFDSDRLLDVDRFNWNVVCKRFIQEYL